MYLKNIKATGFKSFADKIDIELGAGITGIVGPNGSGKSNVVDAVRWVLGEQSVKSLRGDGNMADVIFSGSKSRNPMNVASVTLVFDNKDHYLPLNYDEVALKRRVYKDGTNEYYINGEKCRLKDITDILLDSGIAKESFNIISQGRVEEIISNKASERRIIFEEAAGVLKYKKRKEEAYRKLERTKDNMDRVNDIIKELEVQVEPLKVAKEKALKYLDAQERLKKTEVALLVYDIKNCNEIYQTKKNRIQELNEELMHQSLNTYQGEAKIEEYKLELNKIENKITEARQQLLTMTEQVEKMNSRKNIVLERKKYEVEDTKLHSNVIALQEQKFKQENELHSIQREIETWQIELQHQLENIQSENQKEQAIKKQKQELSYNLEKKVRMENSLKMKIEQLQERIENDGGLPLAIKSVLDHPKLSGIHTIIAKAIEMEERYATAISAALGYAGNYVITEDEGCAKEAISYLKEKRLGRVTFFPLSVIEPRGVATSVSDAVQNMEGFIDIASNLVKYDPKFSNIIKNQLGNVFIVDTIEHATSISHKIHHQYRIITLDGEILHVGGSLTGGTMNKKNNVIQDKFELENQLNASKMVEKEIIKMEDMMNQVDQKLMEIENKQYLLQKQKIECEELIRTKQNYQKERMEALKQITLEIEGTTHILNRSLESEEEQVLKEYYEAVGEKEKIHSTLDRLLKEKNNIAEELNEYEFQVRKESSIVSSKNRELKDLEIEVGKMDVKLDHYLQILNETYSMTFEKAALHYYLEIDSEDARKEVNDLKRFLKDLGMVNLGAIEEYDRISTRYEFLLQQWDDLDQASNTLLEIIKEMDQVMEHDFLETFKIIEQHFSKTFKELFKGGEAALRLTDPNHLLETGIEIVASPPGKKLTSISLLSGGEKTFTAISLLFAILKSRPVPFCILDEVEAALDEVNVDSFGNYLSKLTEKTQFILITHKKKTMEYADVLYGITMQESGVSKLVSVQLEEK